MSATAVSHNFITSTQEMNHDLLCYYKNAFSLITESTELFNTKLSI